ncbi:MAG: hypothetical protein V1859_11160 [archaeon]
MYKDIETEISYKYLSKVISKLNEPVCILGGWAVFFAVNKNYKKYSGKPYLGSRDIDLGFNNISSYNESADILQNEMGFDFVSFRFFKNIHTETGKVLSLEESKTLPMFYIFPLYVDMIFSYTNEELRTELGFAPVDEPLLKHVFDNGKGILTEQYGKKLLLPMPEVLLATKINSAPNRDKVHKRIKDVCDITAICLYSNVEINKLVASAKAISSKISLERFSKTSFDNEADECSKVLQIDKNMVKSVISLLQ